jgi:hypothetical protein
MKTINTDLANDLRNFAIEHSEIQFAHLVSQAMLGEQWAVERVAGVVSTASSSLSAEAFDAALLAAMRATDTSHPSGAVARKFAL